MRNPPGKTAAEVRKEAARIVRDWARGRELCGDPEGAGELRDLAKTIASIRIRGERQVAAPVRGPVQ